MAYIANTAFQPLVTNHEFDSTLNITGLFTTDGDSANGAVCSAGFLAKKSAQLENEGYTGIYNVNTWTMIPAESTDLVSEPIYACNTFNVNQATDGAGNVYKVGANTLGLAVPAGERSTFTKIVFDGNHIYRFGIGNIDGTLGANTFLTIDDGLLSPGATAPASNGVPYFVVVGSGTFTQGAYDAFEYVDVIACVAVA